MKKIYLDFETRSACPLKTAGAWNYALHSTTDILCTAFMANGKEYQTRVECSPEVRALFDPAAGYVVEAHNAQFEYAIYHAILVKKHGWPARLDPALWSCTVARAAMCGLPLALEPLAQVIGAKLVKDLDGAKIMRVISVPVEYVGHTPVWNDNPAALKRVKEYNLQDVRVSAELDRLLPELPAAEKRLWDLDLIMARRGIAVDTALCTRALALRQVALDNITQELKEVTGGGVDKATRLKAFIEWLESRGIEVPTKTGTDGMDKKTIDKVAVTELVQRPDLPRDVLRALELKREAAKSTSIAKYEAALERTGPDGRARGVLQYHGAHTGRWAGRGIQVQNFPKGYDEAGQQEFLRATATPDRFFDRYRAAPMQALSDGLRAILVAAPGHQFVSADFSAIEARVIFWLAGEERALATYRSGGSPYLDLASEIFGRPISKEKDKFEYDKGKRGVLGGLFGMGHVKFGDSVYIETAKDGKPVRLPEDLAKRIIQTFRGLYTKVPALWRDLETAAINAVQEPGRRFPAAGGLLVWGTSRDRRFLCCKLPSGRFLWYWRPEISTRETPFGSSKPSLTYYSMELGEWTKSHTYGGALAENVTQAVARDLMAGAMHRIEAAGFPLVMTVHDELLAEVSEKKIQAEGSGPMLARFQAIMCAGEPWSAGLPVASEGWIGPRYRK